ncbi:MAG TPA: hypothetical protein VFQ84_11030 [Arenimonas sp.]|uniref:hypothetical protein n=1 Tax=Arenimonas sp. TaxID=1872635 RepID=UPI002D7E5B14|nr:hypothetical protein [Arenimonas sp.]HEU0153862.1 hypothetical protein [Arenimonas sp.]
MPRWLWFLLAASLGALLWAGSRGASAPIAARVDGDGPIRCEPPPGKFDILAPLQTPATAAMPPFRLGPHAVTPLAGFAIEARVLGREDYRFDRGAALSPTDLALGWGRMAREEHYRALAISQSGRWYHYRWGSEGPPLPLEEIIRSSANMHLIPADEKVAAAISRVRPDQTVRLAGWLVEVQGEDGWHWRSSLSREDSGDGGCELIYVCTLESW